jgi:hypothetical protein
MRTNVTFNKVVLLLVLLGFFFVIGISYYKYFKIKDFNFIVEAECNPNKENCFERNCAETEECLIPDFNYYKLFKVPAYLFNKCDSNTCSNICTTEGRCEEIKCGDSVEDICSLPSE